MDLKINSSHKKIDLREINIENAKKIATKAGSVALSIAILSGFFTKSEAMAFDAVNTPPMVTEDFNYDYKIEDHDDYETITIDNYMYAVVFDDERSVSNNTYTYDDLKHIKSILLIVRDDFNYDFLNYMPNLESIHITDLSSEKAFQNIDGSRFSKSINITIDSYDPQVSFSMNRYSFLSDIKEINTLEIGDSNCAMNVDSTFLQSLKNVHNLKLGLDITSNFKYQNLTYLDSLFLDGKPYDVAMYFSNEEIEELERASVKVSTNDMEKVKSTNDKIKEIVSSFSLSEDATDQEKLNAVLTYVLTEFTYDEKVSSYLSRGEDVPKDLQKSFYSEGEMTAAFENSSQICGNYAAMTYKLCREVGLDAYNLLSSNHSWNAVKIGDYYYYVDPTWLDGTTVMVGKQTSDENDFGYSITVEYVPTKAEELFQQGNQEEINRMPWYMADPTTIVETSGNESHDLIFVPEGLTIQSIPNIEDTVSLDTEAESEREDSVSFDTEEDILDVEKLNSIEDETEDISQKSYKVTIDKKVFIISGAALAGILSSLGIGILVHKKKEEKRRKERLRMKQNYLNIPSNYYSDFYGSRRL